MALSKDKSKKSNEEKKLIKSKGEQLLEYFLGLYKEGMDYWEPYHRKWRAIKKSYKGIYQENADDTNGANVNIPLLKKIVRNKVSHYQSVLLSKGIDSFDLKPGPDDDYADVQVTKAKIKYDLSNVRIESKFKDILHSYELYGYTVGYVPWREEKKEQRYGKGVDDVRTIVKFNGPDIEVVDITKFLSDPFCNDFSSWKMFIKDNVPVSYLRKKEKDGIFSNIKKLKDVSYPGLKYDQGTIPKDKVQLIEYHGLVPASLLKGNLSESEESNPFEDDYVWAIITVANQKVVIRAEEYPYWSENIFFAAWKDKLIGDNIGIGIGEDCEALVPMVTNLYNQLTNIVNMIALNMYEIVLKDYEGDPRAVKVRPGKFFFVKKPNTVNPINTSAQASALRPLYDIISMFEKIIEELTATPPQVMPNSTQNDVHETLGGLMKMTEQAMRPINAEITNNLEPAFRKIIELFYDHNIQFFEEDDAERILGREKADILGLLGKRITKKDIMLTGSPDIVATGVTGFMENQVELQSLMGYLEIGMKAAMPATNPDGTTKYGPDGQPQMEPVLDIREICKRIGERMRFDDLDKLIPSMKIDKKKQALEEKQKIEQMKKDRNPVEKLTGGSPTPGGPGGGSNSLSPLPVAGNSM
ncbi:MAG: hypothetical protein ACOWWR_18460 [Eubacteriales bacterium]